MLSLSRDLKCIRLAPIRESCYWEILSTFWPSHFVCTEKSAPTHGKREHYCNTACKFFSSNLLNIGAVTRRESRLKVGGAAKPGFLDRWSQLGRNLVATVTICRELATRPPARIGWQPQKYKSTKMHKLQIRKITKAQKYKDLKLQKYNKCLEAASGNWPAGWEPQSAIRRCTVAPRHLARPENFTFKGIRLDF